MNANDNDINSKEARVNRKTVWLIKVAVLVTASILVALFGLFQIFSEGIEIPWVIASAIGFAGFTWAGDICKKKAAEIRGQKERNIPIWSIESAKS
jgi:hypothetical protein